MVKSRYKVTVEKVTRESYQMLLEGENIMEVFDEVRLLAERRNQRATNGQYHVTKIEEERETK